MTPSSPFHLAGAETAEVIETIKLTHDLLVNQTEVECPIRLAYQDSRSFAEFQRELK